VIRFEFLKALLTLLFALVLAGCATPRDRSGESPQDFAFAMLVPDGLALSSTTLTDQSTSALLEPAWYILSSDGVLRVAFGSIDPNHAFPPIVRRVPREQREQLFTRLDRAGLLRPNLVGQPLGDGSQVVVTLDAPATIAPPDGAGAGMVGVWWNAGGRRRSFAILPVQASDAQQATDPGAAQAWAALEDALIMLRRWSWREGNSFEPALGALPAFASPALSNKDGP